MLLSGGMAYLYELNQWLAQHWLYLWSRGAEWIISGIYLQESWNRLSWLL